MAGGAAVAQQGSAQGGEPFDVPSGDIFGFTDPTNTGDPGDKGLSFELTGRAGKRGGAYVSPTLNTEFGVTPAENVELELSSWTTGHRIRGVPELDDKGQVRFDGLSGELTYRFLERSSTNRVAAAFSIEPRWARVDGTSGERETALSTELKLFVDAVIVPDRLFAAVNVNYAPGVSRSLVEARAAWERFSTTNVSGALTYQISERLFIGVEARWLASFTGAFLNELDGHALHIGPTMALKLSDSATLNMVWTPQVYGRADDERGTLDLTNFERHQFGVKFAMSL